MNTSVVSNRQVGGEILVPDGTWVLKADSELIAFLFNSASLGGYVSYSHKDLDAAIDLCFRGFSADINSVVSPQGISGLCYWTSVAPFVILLQKKVNSALGIKKITKFYWPQQSLKGGEFLMNIPVDVGAVIKGGGSNDKDWLWVSFSKLAEIINFKPKSLLSEINQGIGCDTDSDQYTLVRSDSLTSLMNGKFEPYLNHVVREDPAKLQDSVANEVVPFCYDKIWIALPSAEKLARLVTLGVEPFQLFSSNK